MCTVAIAHDRVEAIELILESDLFQKQLTSGECHHVLQEFLHQAIQKRRPDIIRLVVAHGARVNAIRVRPVRGPDDPHNQLERPLTCCAQSGDVACLRVLLASGVVCALYPTLARYVEYRDVQHVRALINVGLDTLGEGVSALHLACQARALESVEALITVRFTDVNAVSKHGVTPLMAAVISEGGGDSAYSIVSLLLASDADARLRLISGETVLHILRDSCRGMETLRLLLTAAPEIVNVQNAGGVTAMQNLVEFFSILENPELLDVLLGCGGDPHIRNNNGESTYQVLVRSERGRAYVKSHQRFFRRRLRTLIELMTSRTHMEENETLQLLQRRMRYLDRRDLLDEHGANLRYMVTTTQNTSR